MLVDRPAIFPAHTLLGNTGGPVVDTGCEVVSGGRVYIDRIEAAEIGRHFGFATPEEVAQVRRALAGRDEKIVELEAKLQNIVESITALTV